MAKPLRFYELKDDDEEYFLADEPMLTMAGLTNDEALRHTFSKGSRIKIALHPPKERLHSEILRESSIPQKDGSLVQDLIRLPLVRAQVMIASWKELPLSPAEEGQDAPEEITHEISEEFYGELHPRLADCLDKAIIAHQFPIANLNPDFTKALQAKLKPSETAKA